MTNHGWCLNVLPGAVHALGNTRRRRTHCAALLLSHPLPARALGRHEVLAHEHRADQPAAAVSGAVAVARPDRPAGLAGSGVGPAVLHFGRRPGRCRGCRVRDRHLVQHGCPRWRRHAAGPCQGGGQRHTRSPAPALDGANNRSRRPCQVIGPAPAGGSRTGAQADRGPAGSSSGDRFSPWHERGRRVV